MSGCSQVPLDVRHPPGTNDHNVLRICLNNKKFISLSREMMKMMNLCYLFSGDAHLQNHCDHYRYDCFRVCTVSCRPFAVLRPAAPACRCALSVSILCSHCSHWGVRGHIAPWGPTRLPREHFCSAEKENNLSEDTQLKKHIHLLALFTSFPFASSREPIHIFVENHGWWFDFLAPSLSLSLSLWGCRLCGFDQYWWCKDRSSTG